MASDFADILPDGFNDYLGYIGSDSRLDVGLSGGWKEWMYYEQGTTVPITFEIYHNGSVDTEEAHVIIENNSTYIIREWEGIYGYFNPVEEFINTLWEELLPAFDYLLQMTPRLDITITGVSGGISAGENTAMSVEMNCLSPRLGSKEGVYILDSADSVLDSLIAVGGDQTLTDQASITLSSDLSDSSISIFIGNNYTGYSEFVLSASTPAPFDPLIVGAVIGVTIAAVVVIVYFVKIR
jgi:hypothetical protein